MTGTANHLDDVASRPHRRMTRFGAYLALATIGSVAHAADKDVVVTNDTGNPVPVTVTNEVQVQADPPVPVAYSGDWEFAGVIGIPPMIIHDLIFFNDEPSYKNCEFSMNFVIDNTHSRPMQHFDLAPQESVHVKFEAGIDRAHLRFGTIVTDTNDQGCVRSWTALGYAVP